MASEVEPAPAAVEPVPELLSRGVYSLYRSPEGAMCLVYRTEGMTEDARIVVPAKMVRFAHMASEGKGPFAMLSKMFGAELGAGIGELGGG